MKGEKLKSLIGEAGVQESKGTSDTIRIWEQYRDQALMWRALTLFQFPVTIMALIITFMLWQSRVTTITVPEKPAPGIYEVGSIPEVELVNYATNFVNLIGSYTPVIARKQFDRAKQYLREPILSRFKQEMMIDELSSIERTSRTQLFFVDPTKTTVKFNGTQAEVSLYGDRFKMIARQQVPLLRSVYTIVVETIPRNDLNQYGLIVTDVYFRDLKEGELG
jgi:hypothetical protein